LTRQHNTWLLQVSGGCAPVAAGTLHTPRLRKEPRAKTYPFVLDPFQETAIACVVRAAARVLGLQKPLKNPIKTYKNL
jgi:hypothetical protein